MNALRFMRDEVMGRILLGSLLWVSFFQFGLAEGWPMAGANPQRTSWTPEDTGGALAELWVRPIEPYISQKVQVVGGGGRVYVSTSRGLYAFDADTGSEEWVYPTAFPLGHSPTYWEERLFVGGLDRKLHALDAKSGEKLWTYSAEGGFQTNPVIAEGRVYAGNRDGHFYALSADTGELVWKFKTGGMILQSAAYQDGVLYFGSMDAKVYALAADDGSVVWISEKLPGLGWRSWWPVIYRDRILMTRSNEQRGGLVPEENEWLFADPSATYEVPGVWGQEPGDWAMGTPTLDIRQNPNGKSIPDYFEEYPYRRNLFVLSQEDGREEVFDLDSDQVPDGPPMMRSVQDALTIYPPVIGFDGVLYSRSISNASGAIPGGLLVGWKIGTPFLSLPVSPMAGQSPDWPIDEPTGVSAAGRYIFWNLCCDRFVGGADLSKPNLPFPNADLSRQWRYVSGGGQPPENTNSLPEGYHSQWAQYNWNPGNPRWYGEHGDNVGPAIYRGKLFVIRSNALIAFAPNGMGRDAPVLAVSETRDSSSLPGVVTKESVHQRLFEEVNKIIQAGHMKPGFGVSGNFDTSARTILGEYLMDYWHNPSDLIITLLRTLPHLPSALQAETRIYLQEAFERFPPYQFNYIGWDIGVQREPFDLPAEAHSRTGFPGPLQSTPFPGWNLAPKNIYAIWKYAEADLGAPEALFQHAKNRLPPSTPMSDPYLLAHPHVHNAYIAGYTGYVKLAQLAGESPALAHAQELQRLLQLRVQTFRWDLEPDTGNGGADQYFYTLITAWNFMELVPELAEFLREHALAKVDEAVRRYVHMAPYWFVSHNEEVQNENGVTPLYQTHALFQARARILKRSYEELTPYLDVPAFPVGDLFYIDNLVAALEADSALETSEVLHFAQFGNGDGVTSTLVLLNPSQTTAAIGSVSVFLPDGSPLGINFVQSGSQGGSPFFSLGPGGSTFLRSSGTGALKVGSARIQADQPLAGTILFSGPFGVAGVGSSRPATRFFAPVLSDEAKMVQTGVAISNPNSEEQSVVLLLRDKDGLPIPGAEAILELEPSGQLAKYPEEIFDHSGLDFSDFLGILDVTSALPVGGMAIRTSPGQFATLGVTIPEQASNTLHFSQFGDGEGIVSTLIVINPSPNETAVGHVELFHHSGSELSLEINGQPQTGSFEFAVPPLAMGVFESGGSGPLQVGSVRVTSSTPIGGTILFSGNFGVSGVVSERPHSDFVVPIESDQDGQVSTGVALSNPWAESVSVLLRLIDKAGQPISGATTEVQLSPHGQLARLLSELFDSAETDLAHFEGALRVSADSPIVGMAIRVSPGEFATLPVTPVSADSAP